MNNLRIITRIEEMDKKRSKIYINQEFAFVLYKGEIAQCKLMEGRQIEDNKWHMIHNEILPKRAKKRSLNLLQKRPYTEQKLREKLAEGYYPEEIIEEAIEYVKSFHYIDDYEYACQYIFYHKESESRRKIKEKLSMKGIDRETLEQAFYDSYDEEEQLEIELQQAKKLLDKKNYDADAADWKEKKKMYAFLVRKGISGSVIRKAMYLQEEVSESDI